MATNATTSTEVRPKTVFLRVTIEELKDRFGPLKSELANGHVIEVIEGDDVVAELRAPSRQPFCERMPDFMARLKEMYGDQVFPDSTPLIRADRDGE